LVTIQLSYTGELHCDATHGPSQAAVATDAPVDNCGRGESFSPTDLVASALGSCMLTVMGIQAQKRDWPFESASATVEKGMVADPVRRIGRLDVEIRVPGAWTPEQREALERAAMSCPVKESVHASIEVPVRFLWGEL